MKKISLQLLFILIILAIILAFFLNKKAQESTAEQKQLPSAQLLHTPSPLPSPITSPAQSSSASKKANTSGRYDFSRINKYLRKDRNSLALCLLRNKELNLTQLEMTLYWEGSGALREIQFKPDPGPSVHQCIHETVTQWSLPAHPGMQPFSYRTTLMPSAS